MRKDIKAKHGTIKTQDALKLEGMNKQLCDRINRPIVGTYLMAGEADEGVKTLDFLDQQ